MIRLLGVGSRLVLVIFFKVFIFGFYVIGLKIDNEIFVWKFLIGIILFEDGI